MVHWNWNFIHLNIVAIAIILFLPSSRVVIAKSIMTTKNSEGSMTKSSSSNPDDNDETTTTSEHLKPWADRWNNKRIGFHLPDVNPILIRNIHLLLPTSPTFEEKSSNNDKDKDGGGTDNDDETCDNKIVVGQQQSLLRVFVPLCGKTVDMAYLTQLDNVEHVVGVDAIRIAVEDFVQEQPQLQIIEKTIDAMPSKKKVKLTDDEGDDDVSSSTTTTKITTSFDHWEGNKISLFVGDFFALKTDESIILGGSKKFDAIFDRGSLVAIDPHMRNEYISIIGNLIAPGGRILLVTLEKQGNDDDEAAGAVKKGPPYSISEDDVRTLFDSSEWVETIEVLEKEDIISSEPPEKVKGLDHYFEIAILITAKR